nr:3-oxoacyl-[acyl-carrier-protein] synthase III C-terminal domain-containing protein [Nostoc sp. EkiNYC01]
MSQQNRAFLTGLGYKLGDFYPIDEIDELKERTEDELLETLLEVGLEKYTKLDLSPFDMARESIQSTLKNASINSNKIDALIYATSSFWNPSFSSTKEISRLINECSLVNPYPIGLFFSECGNMQIAIRVASSLIKSKEFKNVLVVATDKVAYNQTRIVPPDLSICSDAAASCIITSEIEEGFEVVHTTQYMNAAMADIDPNNFEQIEQYLNNAMNGIQQTIHKTMQSTMKTSNDFKQVIMNNYNLSVTQTICKLGNFEYEQVFKENISRFAHAFACDTLINLADFSDKNQLNSGDLLLLLGTGPSTWGANVICKI